MLLGNLDHGSLEFCLRRLRDVDLKHAVLVGRGDLVRLCRRTDHEDVLPLSKYRCPRGNYSLQGLSVVQRRSDFLILI